MKASKVKDLPFHMVTFSINREVRDRIIEAEGCATCESTGNNPETFRDSLSAHEYSISAMCQSCQDEVFGIPEL